MKANFNQLIQSETPVLVDFFATWCGPCKTQSPILEEIAKTKDVIIRILKIDVDKNQEIANRYQVRSIPTLILFKEGKILWRQSGVAQKAQLVELIRHHQSHLK